MIAIVGAGAAGVSAAKGLRECAYKGGVRLLGIEPADPYERPALSKGYLARATDAPPTLASRSELAGLGIVFESAAQVVSVERSKRTLELADGTHVGYDRLLIATGAEPRKLDLPGASLGGIHYLREVADARALRADLRPSTKLVIIGGGVIGLEVAASASGLGAAATVVEMAPRVMGRVVPDSFASMLETLHRARGVEILTSVSPIGFDGSGGRVRSVTLRNGRSIEADVVVVGVGVVPRSGLAAQAGLAVEDGIIVDQCFRSSDNHIFAAGDVARVFHAKEGRHIRFEQWQPAQAQGRHAARSMLDGGTPYRDVPWMWSDQHDLHIQAAGFGFGHAEVVARGSVEERGGLAFVGMRERRVVAVCGVSVETGIARTVRAICALIESGLVVDPEELSDPGVDLRKLVRATMRRHDRSRA